MPEDLKQLVLRTRRQTLRANLCQAYQTLRELPSLSLRLENIKTEIKENKESLIEHAKTLHSFKLGLRNLNLESQQQQKLMLASSDIDGLVGILGGWQEKLQKIEDSSFLAQVKSSGVNEWREELENLAEELRESVKSDAKTWGELTAIETQARENVFGRSVELLGGIALRDARLNAEVCELADELLRAMGALEPQHYAIFGRPQHHPHAARAYCQVAVSSVVDMGPSVRGARILACGSGDQQEGPGRAMKALHCDSFPDTEVDKFLADALAINSVGPAFGYAAITLWFVPSDSQYDLRVRAISSDVAGDERQRKGRGPILF